MDRYHCATSHDLESYGNMIVASQIAGATIGVSLLAIQAFMVLYALSTFFHMKQSERVGRLRFIAISWVILVASSIDTIIDVWRCYRVLYSGGPTGQSYVKAYDESWAAHYKPGLASDVMSCIVIAVGDTLMLWRCFVLWKDKKWIIAFPSLVCLGAVVATVMTLIPGWYSSQSRARFKVLMVSVCMSVATNILVTVLILLRLTMVWRERRKVLSDGRSPLMYSAVATLIIESAGPLAFFGLCFIIATAIDVLHLPRDLVERGTLVILNKVFNWLYYSFCALSPQMIIFRVTTGQSWRNRQETQGGDMGLSQSIQFACTPGLSQRLSESTITV